MNISFDKPLDIRLNISNLYCADGASPNVGCAGYLSCPPIANTDGLSSADTVRFAVGVTVVPALDVSTDL